MYNFPAPHSHNIKLQRREKPQQYTKAKLMKLKCAALTLALVTSLLGPCHTSTAAAPSVQKTLASQYAQMAQAYKNKDLSRFLKPLADNFVTVGIDGATQTRNDYDASEKSDLEDAQSVQEARYKIEKIIVGKSEAVVTCSSRIEFTVLDKDGTLGNKGKKCHFIASGTNYDRWHRAKGQWKLAYEEQITGKITMNGKPFTPITTNQYFLNGKPVHSDLTPIAK